MRVPPFYLSQLHTALTSVAIFMMAINPVQGQNPSFVRRHSVVYTNFKSDNITTLEDRSGRRWVINRQITPNPNRIETSPAGLRSRFTLSSSDGEIVLAQSETPLGFVDNNLLTRTEIYKNNEQSTELRAYKLIDHKLTMIATTLLPGDDYQIQLLSPKSKFFIVNDNIEGDGLTIRVFESDLAVKSVIIPFAEGNRTSEVHWKPGHLYIVSESYDASADPLKIDFYNDIDFSLEKTVSLPKQANLSFSTLLDSGLYIQAFFDKVPKSTFQGYFVRDNGNVISIQAGLVLNHPIEFRDGNQTKLAGLYLYDLVVVSADDGSVTLRRKLLPPTSGKSERFARLGVYSNNDKSLTVLVGRRTSDTDTELEAALLNYSSDDSNTVRKFPLGKISRFSEIKNSNTTLTISEPSKTTVYEKILHP